MIKVIHPGVYSTLQDSGRYGYRSYGVPLSGPMDAIQASLARDLVGGAKNQTVLEFYQRGPTLAFHQDAYVAVTGWSPSFKIGTKTSSSHRLLLVAKGQRLQLSNSGEGLYGYLAVQGGFNSELILGSSSYFSGITKQERLKKNQVLKVNSAASLAHSNAHLRVVKQDLLSNNELIAYKGAEFELLDAKAQEILQNTTFTLAKECNRMGYRFAGETALGLDGILTGPVEPGTVQVTPSGELIVMMRDAQTTGGYARILQLDPISISHLAQHKPGDKLRFSII